MAIAFVQKTTKFTSGGATSITSASITTTAGNKAIVTVSTWISGTNNQPTFTDNKSNTWPGTADATLIDGSLGNGRISINSAQIATGGASHTFTVTGSAGTAFEGNVSEFSGLLTAVAKDQSATASIAASATTKTVTSGTTTQASELVVAAINVNSSDATCNITDPPTGYTSIGVNQDSNATIGYESAYKIIAATGAQSAVWTFDSTTSGGATGIVTYKATGGSPDVTLALTGVSGTGSAGTSKAAIDKALTGNSATGSVGTVLATRTVPLTGVTGTGSVGTVSPNQTIALTGVTGTGSVGTVSAGGDVTLALTGVTGTGSVGTVKPTLAIALTGVSGTGIAGTVTPSLALPLTGVSGTGSVGTVSPANVVPLTGVTGTGSVGTVTASGAGTAALTGVTGTGSAGTVAPLSAIPLTGVSGTGSVGTVGPANALGLTGITGTGSVGTLGAAVVVALTGVSATGSVGSVTVQSADVTIALTGVTAVGSVGTVTASGGDVGTAPSGGFLPRKKKEFDRDEARDILKSFDALSGPRRQEVEEVIEAVELEPVVEVAPIEDDEEDELFLLLHA